MSCTANQTIACFVKLWLRSALCFSWKELSNVKSMRLRKWLSFDASETWCVYRLGVEFLWKENEGCGLYFAEFAPQNAIILTEKWFVCRVRSNVGSGLVHLHDSSNGAPWARPGAMPRGPKWGGANFAPPQKRAQGQLPIFYFLT